jgi:hypothetical protein
MKYKNLNMSENVLLAKFAVDFSNQPITTSDIKALERIFSKLGSNVDGKLIAKFQRRKNMKVSSFK